MWIYITCAQINTSDALTYWLSGALIKKSYQRLYQEPNGFYVKLYKTTDSRLVLYQGGGKYLKSNRPSPATSYLRGKSSESTINNEVMINNKALWS